MIVEVDPLPVDRTLLAIEQEPKKFKFGADRIMAIYRQRKEDSQAGQQVLTKTKSKSKKKLVKMIKSLPTQSRQEKKMMS